jgi:hypothetical protein
MANEFSKIIARTNALTGAGERKYYGAFDEPPSNDEVAQSIKGIQGEISDQLAWKMESVRLLISIKNGVWTSVFLLAAIFGMVFAAYQRVW